jgi:hypothetical protein
MSTSSTHREIVQKLIDSKAVDFSAIGKVIAEVGPSLALSEDFDGDGFCGTNRHFVRLLYLPDPYAAVESLEELSSSTDELK